MIDPTTTFPVSDDTSAYKYQLGVYPPTCAGGCALQPTLDTVDMWRFLGATEYIVTLGFMRWDTSSLSDAAIVTAATFR